ncbi:unnamed protein product [Thelazia callipaeda]|uniref:Protein S-acyltransferase n=1 Tax=Thelazia callipaeda TaxID=103827 RepID=A0A0N5CLW8_THECL|nr:unnamed protein product [Thelazia callipaeda]
MSCADNTCLRGMILIVRWIPVVFILALLSWAYYAYVVQLCIFTVVSRVERGIYIFVFHLLLLMFLWSYYETIFQPIGQPPKIFYVDAETRRELLNAEESECREILNRYVRQYQIPVDNRNYDGGKNTLRVSAGFGRFHILFLFFVAGMFAASITCLFAYHLYLTARNRSTIESFRPPVFVYGSDKNGFNLGVRHNFRQIFGDSCLLCCGNGVQYPVGSGAAQQSHISISMGKI